jgi:hypothetical protein
MESDMYVRCIFGTLIQEMHTQENAKAQVS